MWKKYKNKGRYSSIRAYKVTKGKFYVKTHHEIYMFQKENIGECHMSLLINCARNGQGLERYINQFHLDYQTVN